MAEIRNLLPDPWPNSASGWVRTGSADDFEFRMTQAGTDYYLKNLAGTSNCFVSRSFPDMPAGEYVLGAYIYDFSHGDVAGNVIVKAKCGANYLGFVRAREHAGAYVAAEFTTTANGLTVIIQPPAGVNRSTRMRYLTLMSQKDWDTMRNLKNDDGTAANIRWFAPPKSAAAGVMSTPALDRGGVLS